MPNNELDDRMKRLLREIRGGKKGFSPAGDSEEARREFDRDVKCLIRMSDMGLIPVDRLHVRPDKSRDGFEYLSAVVRGLTYKGELAADELDLSPASEALGELLSHQGLQACRRDYERAVTNIASDPAQAIASASSTLESICLAILDRLGKTPPNDRSIQPLMKTTMDALHLAPEPAAEGEIKRILGAVMNIAAGVGVLRTKYGSAHGRNDEHTPPTAVHARLVINSMAAVALFLLESILEANDSPAKAKR